MGDKMEALGTVGGGAVAALTWESIPQTFESLEIQYAVQENATTWPGYVYLYLSYNNDITEARWWSTGQKFDGSAWSAYSSSSATTSATIGYVPGTDLDTDQRAGGVIRIMNYSTAHRVAGEGLRNISAYSEDYWGTNVAAASPQPQVQMSSHGHDTNTGTPAAGTSINRIDLFFSSGQNFTTSSRATLYGLPKA
mgnify:CR=1 FL=1|tara:strand:- start:94 stop:678 length:585 start_codon:yes stop_codon:yes gene_type:complete